MSNFLDNAFGVFLGMQLADIFKKKPVKPGPTYGLKPLTIDSSLPFDKALEKHMNDVIRRGEEINKRIQEQESLS